MISPGGPVKCCFTRLDQYNKVVKNWHFGHRRCFDHCHFPNRYDIFNVQEQAHLQVRHLKDKNPHECIYLIQIVT